MNTYEYQKKRGVIRKLHLLKLRGGCCENCGYDKNLAALEFHHVDPKEKENQLDMRTLSNSTMEWVMREFKKCKVLCANCHREEHSPDLFIDQLPYTGQELFTRVKRANKPKCIDCGVEINYLSTRCSRCEYEKRRVVVRPSLSILRREREEHGPVWCGKKYGVTHTTINRWLNKK